MLDEISQQLAQIFPCLAGFMHELQRAHRAAFQDALRHRGDGLHGGEAKDLQYIFLMDRVAAEGHELVEH